MSGETAIKETPKKEDKKPEKEPDLQIVEEDLFEDFPVDAGEVSGGLIMSVATDLALDTIRLLSHCHSVTMQPGVVTLAMRMTMRTGRCG